MNTQVNLSAALDLAEVAELCALHARAGGLSPRAYRDCVAAVEAAGGDTATWTAEWLREGRRLRQAGRSMQAMQAYNLARFPFADTAARRTAVAACSSCFLDVARSVGAQVESIEVEHAGGTARAYLVRPDRPAQGCVVICGGIVSLKEQWFGFVRAARRLRVDVILTEMPQVGENTVPYTPESGRFISGLLDRAGIGPGAAVHVVALSFSANLVLRAAAKEPRIAAVSTVGAPIRAFFEDAGWWAQVPQTTRLTLAHMLGVTDPDVAFARLGAFALSDAELSRLTVPLFHVRAKRDEILQPEDAMQLEQAYAGPLRLLEIDDVHGAPNQLGLTRLFIAQAIQQGFAPRAFKTAVLRALTGLKALRGGATMRGRVVQ